MVEWLDLHRTIEALGPGRTAAPIADAESPVTLYVAPPRRPEQVRRRLVQALAVLALFAAVFFLDRSETALAAAPGGDAGGNDLAARPAGCARPGHPARVICDTGGHHVGYIQDADGLAEVGEAACG